MLSGCLDGSAAMLAAAAADRGAGGPAAELEIPPGLLVNSVGSTDVLAMAVAAPRPVPRLLTRALGVGRNWVVVATLASAGTTVDWARRTLFPDLQPDEFHRLVRELGTHKDDHGVRFRPYLAGDRTTLNQPRGGFSGITLGTTREHMLAAILDGLAAASAARVPRLAAVGTPRPLVYVTGGAVADVLYRDWPSPPDGERWERRPLAEATLAGAAVLADLAAGRGPR
jgi:xylulokinase